MRNPLVYICSPYSGDVKENTAYACACCRFAISRSCCPIAPHLHYPQFLLDWVRVERETGMLCGMRLMECCSEVWVFGEDGLTDGMSLEVTYAAVLGKKIRYFNKAFKEEKIDE